MSGYFSIGIFQPKTPENVGNMWRCALLFGAAYIFTIGHRYKRQPMDTFNSSKHVPLFGYASFEDFVCNMPTGAALVGVELVAEATPLEIFRHPKQAIYLLGSENGGLPVGILRRCAKTVRLPGKRSLNVSTAAAIAMYDRHLKRSPTTLLHCSKQTPNK